MLGSDAINFSNKLQSFFERTKWLILGGICILMELTVRMNIVGGLLIVFPREDGAAYAKKMEQLEGLQSWIVGVVQKGTRSARVIDKPRIIEVPMKDKPDELW